MESTPLEELQALHAEVEARARALADRLDPPLTCARGCSACCLDDLTVFAVEADLIRRNHSRLLDEETPHPEGACAFLDGEGACRIYPSRPYFCRTQGLPLRWLEDEEENRDICPLNRVDAGEGRGRPDGLDADQCWTLGPFEVSA